MNISYAKVYGDRVSGKTAEIRPCRGGGFEIAVEGREFDADPNPRRLSADAFEAGAKEVRWTGPACLAWFELGG